MVSPEILGNLLKKLSLGVPLFRHYESSIRGIQYFEKQNENLGENEYNVQF